MQKNDGGGLNTCICLGREKKNSYNVYMIDILKIRPERVTKLNPQNFCEVSEKVLTNVEPRKLF